MITNPLKAKSKTPILQLTRPFQAFAAREASGGIVLLLGTVAALGWANSPYLETYRSLWHTKFAIGLAEVLISHDLHFWVNDALMAIFFFVVGLEIKRELLVGELATPRRAALPIAGALGGVLVPALIYFLFNVSGPGKSGWGIPMATDIAFVIGVMAILGDRVPLPVRVFLTALAIVDDIVAVLVIALFYTSEITQSALLLAAVCFLALIFTNRLGVRHPLPYSLLGGLLWYAVLQSGVHATVAGILLAFTIPSRTIMDSRQFLLHGRWVLDEFEKLADRKRSVLNDEHQQMAIEALEDACEKVQPPLHRLQQTLHPWVTFCIMPLFAFANAGVVFADGLAANLSKPVAVGVALGLFFGKPIGITLASWIAVRSGLAVLPSRVTWTCLHGAAWLGGIGFTMSLFLAGLAFTDDALLANAKFGIFAGSIGAALIGATIIVRTRQTFSN